MFAGFSISITIMDQLPNGVSNKITKAALSSLYAIVQNGSVMLPKRIPTYVLHNQRTNRHITGIARNSPLGADS